MDKYWVAFILVMGLANVVGFGLVAYLKHERKEERGRRRDSF